MDKPALSSNWKKLQATLKKDTPAKRKPSQGGDDTVKKRKLTEKQKPYRESKPAFKRKRMSETEDSSNTPATRRKSNAAAPVQTEKSSRHKENEGRSAT